MADFKVGDRVKVRDSYEPLEEITAVREIGGLRCFTTGRGKQRSWCNGDRIEYIALPVYMTPERIARLDVSTENVIVPYTLLGLVDEVRSILSEVSCG